MFVQRCQPQEILHLLFRRGRSNMIPKIYESYDRYMTLEQAQLRTEQSQAFYQTMLTGQTQRTTLAVTESGVVFPQH